jgi:KaiC/GvpD/RAD55 family RecA-like ATPase
LVPPSKKGALGKLLGSDTRAELLTFFHSNPRTADSLEGLAARVGRKPSEIESDLTELVEIGLLREQKIYSLDPDRDVTLQREISDELKETTAQQEQEPLEEVTRELTGIEIIDHIVPSGIPSPVMLLIMGDPGTAKRELCLEFVVKWLRQKRRVVYLTLEQSPEEIRTSLNEMGNLGPLVGPFARPERMRDLVMIDCYSPQIGMTSNEELSADPNNLSELSIAVSKALENRTQGLFLLDSLDTLIRKRGLASSLELIRTLRAKTRIVKFDSIVTLNRQAFPTAILAAVQESADGVFEMKVQEEPSGLTRYFRVPKMRGTSHHSAWRAYELDFKTHAKST